MLVIYVAVGQFIQLISGRLLDVKKQKLVRDISAGTQ